MNKTVNKMKFQMDQLALVVAVFALVGVGALAVSQARHGAGTGATGNATVGATPECIGGAWVNHVNVISNTSRLGEIDIYETLNSTQVIKVASQLSLSTTTPTKFDTRPASGVSDDVLYAAPFSDTPVGSVTATPGNEVLARSNTYTNPCLPTPTSGKNRI